MTEQRSGDIGDDALLPGRLVSAERRRLGWSQQDLAERVGVSRSRLQQIETSDRPIPPSVAAKLSESLSIKLDQGNDLPPLHVIASLANRSEGGRARLREFLELLEDLTEYEDSDAASAGTDQRDRFLINAVNELWAMIVRLGRGLRSDTTVLPEISTVDLWAGLVEGATATIKATNPGSIGRWWDTRSGKRYLTANLEAVQRNVRIQRLFILDRPLEIYDQDIAQVLEQMGLGSNSIAGSSTTLTALGTHSPDSIEARFISTADARMRPGFLLIDGVLLASQTFGPDGHRDYSDVTVDQLRCQVSLDTFEKLFASAVDIVSFRSKYPIP